MILLLGLQTYVMVFNDYHLWAYHCYHLLFIMPSSDYHLLPPPWSLTTIVPIPHPQPHHLSSLEVEGIKLGNTEGMLDNNLSSIYPPHHSLLSSPLSYPLFSPQTPSPPAYPTVIKPGCFKIGQHPLLITLSSLTPPLLYSPSSSPISPLLSLLILSSLTLTTSPHSPSPHLPLQVGGIKPGCFKIGNTGGMLDNILSSKLYRPGSVAYVSRSGGMSNELNNIISMNTNGVYEGVAIGGDRYPGMYCITDAVQRCTCVECARSRNNYFPIIKCLFLPFYSIFYTSTHTPTTMLVLWRFTNCIR